MIDALLYCDSAQPPIVGSAIRDDSFGAEPLMKLRRSSIDLKAVRRYGVVGR